MFGLGVWELLLVLIVVVFIYGGKRLPQIGQGLGQSIREFKEAYHRHSPKDDEELQSHGTKPEELKPSAYLTESGERPRDEKPPVDDPSPQNG